MNTDRRQNPRDLPFSDPHCTDKARDSFVRSIELAGVVVLVGLLAGWLA